MNELINKLKEISSLQELENLSSINPNILLYAIIQSQKYDLLKNNNIRLNLSDFNTLEPLIELFLSDEDYLYFIHQFGFTLSKEELNTIFSIIFPKYRFSHQFETFLKNFFPNKNELDSFIKEHISFFETLIKEQKQDIPYILRDCPNFIELIIKHNLKSLIGNIENYSLSNLKLLAQYLKQGNTLPYYLGNERFAKHLFEHKSNLNPLEFITLLDLLKDPLLYSQTKTQSDISSFSLLVNENVDFLIDAVSQTNKIPQCLAQCHIFRDACLKKNRIDLAVNCILPPNIIKDERLINAYCQELNIKPQDFYESLKWLYTYYEKNNNIFNTILTTSLKSNIFNLNKEHFERFINDVEFQISLSKLDDKELSLLSKILNHYNYKEFDPSSMIESIIKNISAYQDLINSLDLENLSNEDLKKLVSILQLPNNPYQIKDINSLQNYDSIKKQYYTNNFSLDLPSNKDNLLKALFNIDLKEAQYINSKYCHDNDNNNILNNLKNSELPPEIYNYLALINKIIECLNPDELKEIYDSLKDTQIYALEIPFEAFLRAKYTEIYSKSLYKVDEKNQVYGPLGSISSNTIYHGKNVQLCVPRTNFNFFVHCVGSCSLASDVTDTNYCNDWLNRPRIQDHFIACSYINELGIYSIRSNGSIIFGFDTLEGGSILGMGNTDIDSIGRNATIYNGSHALQEENKNRARYFVPSEILKTINNGYNEIVIERRNTDTSKSNEFKRKPDYIIMMAESLDQDNFNLLETLYHDHLPFISEEDKLEIEQISNSKTLKKFLVKYKNIISENAHALNIPLNTIANIYVSLIMKAKYYEDCLKASSEFDIPLIIVDKAYYFNKILAEATAYDEETKQSITALYLEADETKKKQIFNMVAKGQDLTQLMKPTEQNRISFKL